MDPKERVAAGSTRYFDWQGSRRGVDKNTFYARLAVPKMLQQRMTLNRVSLLRFVTKLTSYI